MPLSRRDYGEAMSEILSIMSGILSIILGFILGLVAQSIADDSVAVKKCRITSFELKRLLEKLAKLLFNSSRPVNSDFEKLSSIKLVIEKIIVERCGLFVGNKELDVLISQSNSLLTRLAFDDANVANKPNIIASKLLQVWETERTRPYEPDKLIKIQKFLHKSLMGRIWSFITNKV